MWMNARPSLGSVKEEIASILLDLLSANALLDTNLMKCHKNVKVRNIRLCSWKMEGQVKSKSVASFFCKWLLIPSVFVILMNVTLNITFAPGIIRL